MPQTRRVAIALSENLLAQVDQIVRRENGSRSEFIREAMQKLVLEREKVRAEQIRSGYRKMGPLNRELAEEGLAKDNEEFNRYEAALAGEA